MRLEIPKDTIIKTNHSDYKIIAPIGYGAVACVWKILDLKSNEHYAIKIYYPEFKHRKNEKFKKRFLLESKALAKIKHNNIISIIEDFDYLPFYWEEGDAILSVHEKSVTYSKSIFNQANYTYFPFFIMEYCDNNLREYIENNNKYNNVINIEKIYLMLQICEGLHALHLSSKNNRKNFHRDINPNNLLIKKTILNNSKGFILKICDFGFSHFCEEFFTTHITKLTSDSFSMQTENFSSPEQKGSAKDVTYKTDIYSAGCVFYTLITGEVYNNNLESIYDEKVRFLLRGMLQKNPKERFELIVIKDKLKKLFQYYLNQKISINIFSKISSQIDKYINYLDDIDNLLPKDFRAAGNYYIHKRDKIYITRVYYYKGYLFAFYLFFLDKETNKNDKENINSIFLISNFLSERGKDVLFDYMPILFNKYKAYQ